MSKKRILAFGLALIMLGASVLETTAFVRAETPYIQINEQRFELPNLVVDVEELPIRQELQGNLYAGYCETVYFVSPFSIDVRSYNEKAAARLDSLGVSLNFLETMSEEQIGIIASAEKAFITHSYYYYHELDEYADTILTPISRADFNRHMQNQITPTEIADYIFNQLQVSEYVGIEALSEVRYVQAQHIVGGGVLHVQTIMFHEPVTGFIGRYVAVAEFFWSSMPGFRGTDFFALGRGSEMSIIGNGDFGGFVEYREYRRAFTAYPNWVHQTSWGTTFHFNNNPRNELGTVSQGAGLRLNVRSDRLPPPVLGVGTTAVMSLFYGLSGGVMYTGTISSFSPGQVQTRTHYVSYLHQNATILIVSPSLSVSMSGPSVSFSVSHTAQYARAVQNNLSVTWRS